jgi:hypothetical protein
MILRCKDENPEEKEYPLTMQNHGTHTYIGKVIRDGLLRIMTMETIKGITHAHPAIWRPKKGKIPAEATRVEITTIQTIKGTSIFLNFIDLKSTIFILKY